MEIEPWAYTDIDLSKFKCHALEGVVGSTCFGRGVRVRAHGAVKCMVRCGGAVGAARWRGWHAKVVRLERQGGAVGVVWVGPVVWRLQTKPEMSTTAISLAAACMVGSGRARTIPDK